MLLVLSFEEEIGTTISFSLTETEFDFVWVMGTWAHGQAKEADEKQKAGF